MKVALQIDPESFNHDMPPFSIQTLAENAVHRAISIRPEGGSIVIALNQESEVVSTAVLGGLHHEY